MDPAPYGSPAVDTAIGVGAVVAAVAIVVVALLLFVVLRKGRKMPGDHVFRASAPRSSRPPTMWISAVESSPPKSGSRENLGADAMDVVLSAVVAELEQAGSEWRV